MPLNINNTTVICPQNDAESYTIIELSKLYEFDLRISSQKTWFCPLEKEDKSTFKDLNRDLVIVEMPSLLVEKELEQLGHNLHIIDHHSYPSFNLVRDNSLSSLEQFANLIGHKLSRKETAISINDQLYIYGLFEHGYSIDEIKEVREFDLKCQGYTEENFATALNDFKTRNILANNVICYDSSSPRYTYLLDLHVMSLKGKFSNVLISGNTGDHKGKYIFFSGEMRIIEKLKRLGGYSKKSNDNYGLYGGYEFGDEQIDLKKAKSIISES